MERGALAPTRVSCPHWCIAPPHPSHPPCSPAPCLGLPQAKQDLDQVKEMAGQAVKGLSSMANKLMSELGKY